MFQDDPSTTARGNHEGGKSPTSTLQQMSTTMAKEACRKLYLRVKTLDRENSALQTLSQSLNEENTTLKKLNESLTKNNDTSSSGLIYVTFYLLYHVTLYSMLSYFVMSFLVFVTRTRYFT